MAYNIQQEVCHRGFAGIAKMLEQAGADLQHIPNADASGGGAQFMRGAPQSALGEAARGGFTGVRKNALFSLDAVESSRRCRDKMAIFAPCLVRPLRVNKHYDELDH